MAEERRLSSVHSPYCNREDPSEKGVREDSLQGIGMPVKNQMRQNMNVIER